MSTDTVPPSADLPVALDATIDAALATLGPRGVELERRPDLTIPHLGERIATDATLAPVASDSPTGPRAADPSRPGVALRSLGPASVSIEGLPRLSVVRSDGGGAEHDAAAARSGADLHVVSVLGEGGMGRVELARQRSLRREVAVKSARNPTSAPANGALLREALFTGYLEHPNIVPVHQLGRLDEGPVLVMKRVDGVSWRELIADPEHPHWSHRPGDPQVRHLEILRQVCNAVEFAHSRGIVHRDIKPENVMLGEYGEVYLMDWGVALDIEARAEPSSSLVGTPAYLAPEMLDGDAGVGAWTDVYLLGACLYEVLTGEPPHRGEGIRQTLVAAFQSEIGPFPDGAPEELVAIVRLAMARSPAERRASMPGADALRDAVADYLRHRAARELVERAQTNLERALAAEDVSESERRGALAEARFGFREALREWPESEEARDGLQRALTLQIRQELDARNHGLAAALYDDLPRPEPDLGTAIDALAADLEADHRSRVALEELQRERDPKVGARRRSWLILGAGTVVAGINIAVEIARQLTSFEPTHGPALLVSTVVAAMLVAAVFAARHDAMRSEINRQLSLTLVLLCVAFVLTHAVCWMAGMTLTETVVGLLVILACFVGMTAILDQRLKWLVPPALAGPFIAALMPEYVHAVQGAVIFVIAFDIAWFWRAGGDADHA